MDRLGPHFLVAIALATALLLLHASGGKADVLPGSDRPELERRLEDELPHRLELPPPPEPAIRAPSAFAAGHRTYVRGFRVEGSTVFSTEELALVTAPWSDREITAGELLSARDAVTQHYLEAGFLTSGAFVPDQDSDDGVVLLRVVEGSLEEIEVRGVVHFRPGYFRTRLRRAARAPLNVFRLEEQLQHLQRDPELARVHARLEPGSRRGLSRLRLDVEESRFYGLDLEFSNENSPSIGSYTGALRPRISNLLGYGDVFSGEFELTDGLRDFEASFSVPLTAFDTRLSLRFQQAESEVVQAPFDEIDVESESRTWGITLSQPVLRTRLQRIELGVTGEHRRSETDILGRCFAFLLGTSSCTSKVSVLRFFGQWIVTTPHDALALRSTLSVGIHALGSTQRGGGLADSEYVSWLGQIQWAHRLPAWLLETEVLVRADSQIASQALLGIEKFSVGGARTVRGYRENEFVRDNGLVTSFELRIPVWHDGRGRPTVQIAPFFDYGRSWDDGGSDAAESISSVGIGLRLAPVDWLRGELYWGYAFEDFEEFEDDPQNDGLHFSITLTPF